MITSVGADETHGEVYGFSLVYSGNHSTVAKIDQFGNLKGYNRELIRISLNGF